MNSSAWRPMRLDELGEVARGKSRHRPRNDHRLFGGPYPYIQTADIMAADPYIVTYNHTLSEFGLAQSRLWPANTLCITIAGANTARTAILKIGACFPDSIIGFRPTREKSNIHFVKYSLDLMKNRFLAITRGATQDNLSLDKLLSFPILTPPLEIQKRIAGILSAYDDLIAVNARRIAILEDMARRLFDEWFIKFRHPGQETVGFAKDLSRSLPEHWCTGTLADIAEFVGTSINPRAMPDRLFTHFSIPSFDVERVPVAEKGSLILSNKLIFSPPVVLISKLNPRIPRVWRVQEVREHEPICSTEFLPLKPKSGTGTGWLTGLCTSEPFMRLVKGIAQGTSTSHQRARPQDILGLPIIIPPSPLRQRADRILADNFDLVTTLLNANSTLRTARDALLPRLISGEIDLIGAEEEIHHAPDRTAAA